jgi:hypothetical protein
MILVKIVSTTVTANFSAYRGRRPAIMEQAAYFADAKTGGNVLTIDFGHCEKIRIYAYKDVLTSTAKLLIH